MRKLRALGGGLCAVTALLAPAIATECGGGGGARADAGDSQAEAVGWGDTTLDAAEERGDAVVQPEAMAEAEAAVDTGLTDAEGGVYVGDACPPPLDAGIISDWPGFRRLTELDPCCAADVALDAAQAAPPVQWTQCTNGASGCLQMHSTWGNTTEKFNAAEVSVAVDGTPEYLDISRTLTNVYGEDDIYALYEFSGAADNVVRTGGRAA